jgi:CBS domain-containing protein
MTAVADVMTRGVRSMTPEDPLIKAAQAMEELNVGAIPVCEGHRLVGMVTDRDIVVRGVARERDPRLCRLGDIMSEHVRTVRESDDVEEVLSEMASAKIRRMPVVDHQDHLVGIITLGDIAAKIPDEQEEVGESLAEISTPAQPAHAHLPG